MKQQPTRPRRDDSHPPRVAAAFASIALAVLASRADAVVLADPAKGRNVGAPTGDTLVPYNLEGQFGGFLGTPIAPNLFIAAKHIGGSVGQAFAFGGQTYTTSAFTDIANSDLRVWRIDTSNGKPTFGTSYATLFQARSGDTEAGKELFVVGRGGERGDPYVANGTQRGWLWGGGAFGEPSWGKSTVGGIASDDKLGDFVAFDFNFGSGVALTIGDSSGGLFVKATNGQWQLAGINYGVDGGWSDSPGGPFVNASIYDARGLFVGNAAQSDLIPTGGADAIAASSYASRISSNRAAINAIFLSTGNAALVPEPSSILILAAIALVGVGRTRRPT